MDSIFHPDGTIDAGDERFEREFLQNFHPTEAEKARRYLVELPATTLYPDKRPTRLWMTQEELALRGDSVKVLARPGERVSDEQLSRERSWLAAPASHGTL